MKNRVRRCLGPFGVALTLALASQAAFALSPGQKLSKAEIAQWGTLTTYDIGGSRLRLIPPQHSGSEDTLLLNARGVVGSSRNEIVIAGVGAEAQAVIQQTQPRPTSVQHFEATGITMLKYADFGQAVEALAALKAALPDAQIGLPVMFSKQAPN